MTEPLNIGRRCLKCTHVRTASDPGPEWACPQCNAVYAKLEKLEAEGRLGEAFRSNAITPTLSQMPKRTSSPSARLNTDAHEQPVQSLLVICAKCRGQVSKGAAFCAHCGVRLIEPTEVIRPVVNRKLSRLEIIAGLGLALIFLAMFIPGGETAQKKDRCNAQVCNSEWDGSVYQVEKYLESTLKDPDSYQSVEWSKVISMKDGNFAVRHKYRAKNSFGGYVLSEQLFMLTPSGSVISAVAVN